MTSYAQSGVNIDAGEQFASMIRERVQQAWPETAKEIGGFAGGGPIPEQSTTCRGSSDGAGTKALLGAMTGRFEGIGIDAVAMSAVDMYVSGARPAFLLDVLDVAQLRLDTHIKIIDGIITGCLKSGCRLIGGETAELPDMFRSDWMLNINTTVIGFTDPTLQFVDVKPGQQVWGWLSGGCGSNGYSLIRRALGLSRLNYFRIEKRKRALFSEEQIKDMLLKPTPIWINEIEEQRHRGVRFAGHAHITGGGLVGNIPRILPDDCKVVIDRSAWERPKVFRYIEWVGEVSPEEMDRVFNQGIMVVSITDPAGIELQHPGARLIGEVARRVQGESRVVFKNKIREAE